MIALLLALAFAQEPPAGGDLDGAGLDPIGQQLYRAALQHERGGQWSRAAAAYELVLERDPAYSQAGVGLARCHEQQGELDDAVRVLRQMPMDADAVQALARLIREEHPEEAVELYRRLRKLRLGDAEPWRLESEASLLSGDLAGSVATFETYLELGGPEEDPTATGLHLIALAEALKAADQREEARAWLESYLELWPEGALAEEVRARLERLDVEAAAAVLAIGGAEALDPQQRKELEEARLQIAQGRLERARARLDVLLELAPRSPEVWGASGDVALELGDIAGAEQAYLTAIALEPDEATWRVSFGLLLARRYGGRRHREAADELERDQTLRPAWVELLYLLGTIRQQAGDFPGAVDAYERYVDRAPEGEFAEQARLAIADLVRTRPDPPEVEALLARPPDGIAESAWLHFKLAKVYLERQQDDDKALIEVQLALEESPEYVDALNLLAHLQLRAADSAGALQTYERSLEVRPVQPLTVLAIGYLHQDAGHRGEAADAFHEAAQLGAEEAWYALAALADEEGDWLEARKLLSEYFARATGGRRHEAAVLLRDELETRFRLTFGGAGAAGLALIAVPAVLFWRRRTGATLQELLEVAPESYHDVATVLSAMRHEVLKHNTTVLPAAAAALQRGDPVPAAEAVARLVRGGILERWNGYVRELERIGRRHAMRLNLRRLDPVIAPMCAAFADLADAEDDVDELLRISHALNHTGYIELGRILAEVCVLPVDGEVLRDCWLHLTREPAFAGRRLPELELRAPEEALPVRIFRGELEDIVVNILRNGLNAVLDEREPGQRRIGLSLDTEADFVTGLEWVVLRFLDNAVSPLTDEMIRGRYIARGLGLTVDLVTRQEGSIKVEAQEGWQKAIVVRLPRAEIHLEGR